MSKTKHIIVVGTGIGGLATALRLLAIGAKVTVLEAAATPGGKMRTVPTVAGPADAGPTVFTMRWVFEELFRAAGENLSDHITLTQSDVLARHFWSDGPTLDLFVDQEESAMSIKNAFGSKAANEFSNFSARAKRLFEAFDGPMMQAGRPSNLSLGKVVLSKPRMLADMAPHKTLAQLLRSSFSNPKLQQLFGRYATYVGGSPYVSPALLSLIWHAERTGVWAIEGGMHRLALAVSDLIETKGGDILYNSQVSRITPLGARVRVSFNGTHLDADAVVFNGDPRALERGLLGHEMIGAIDTEAVTPRSLSANVMAFAAEPSGQILSHHNVFFCDDPLEEFAPLAKGLNPDRATLYVCAQDRGGGHDAKGPERFEIIMNSAPCLDSDRPDNKKAKTCQMQMLDQLEQMGLRFSPRPTEISLTQAEDFNLLFPASLGSLYGRSPHGMTAALKRPTARTAIKGVYLAGGGAHPGAGVPMATLSGKHAAEAIAMDLALI